VGTLAAASRDECLTRRLEMRACGRANVDDLGLRLPQQVRERGVGRGVDQGSKLPGCSPGGVTHSGDDVPYRYASQSVDMQPSHFAGADESDPDRALRCAWLIHAGR
jgi:hypothetical protein